MNDASHPARADLIDAGLLIPDAPPLPITHGRPVLRLDDAARVAVAKHIAAGYMPSLLDQFVFGSPWAGRKPGPKRAPTTRRGRRTS